MAKRKPSPCRRCRLARRWRERAARDNFAHYATMAETPIGTFNIQAAELILKLAPRDPVVIPIRWLRRHLRRHHPQIIKRHLPHVDNAAVGICATVTHIGRPFLMLIEGFHRATNHVAEGTDWSCYVLTAEESYAILTP